MCLSCKNFENDVVKTVFIKYLQNLGKTPKPRKRNIPGPDVIIESKACECKGSQFEDSLFKQLVKLPSEEKESKILEFLDFDSKVREYIRNIVMENADISFLTTSLRTIPTDLEGIRAFLDRFRNGLVVPLRKEKKEKVKARRP